MVWFFPWVLGWTMIARDTKRPLCVQIRPLLLYRLARGWCDTYSNSRNAVICVHTPRSSIVLPKLWFAINMYTYYTYMLWVLCYIARIGGDETRAFCVQYARICTISTTGIYFNGKIKVEHGLISKYAHTALSITRHVRLHDVCVCG